MKRGLPGKKGIHTHSVLLKQRSILCMLAAALIATTTLHADQIEMKNGDHYTGKVVSLSTNMLVLQSDVLGTIKLPRDKVAGVVLGTIQSTNGATLAHVVPLTNNQFQINPATVTNSPADASASLRQLGSNTNLVQQIQAQFLADAGPEANNKFNELMGGLASGKLNINDLRKQAKTAADQIKQLKKDLGDDASAGALDGYLEILESFIQESGSQPTPTPGAAPQAPTAPATRTTPVAPKPSVPSNP